MIRRHWRGETPILTAVLGVGVLACVLLAAAGRLLLAATQQLGFSIAVASCIDLVWLLFCFGVWFWAVVGIWRSAGGEQPQLRWAVRGVVLLATWALVPLAVGSVQAAGELVQLAAGSDPLGDPIEPFLEGDNIVVVGTLAQGSAAAFEEAVNRSDASTLRLTSRGGRIAEAERIADLVKKARLDIEVEGVCASACTVVMLAGRRRSVRPGARVGFHQSTFSGNGPADDRLQSQSLRTRFRKAGVNENFIRKAFSTRSDTLWYPTEEEMLDAGFLTTASLNVMLQEFSREISKSLPRRLDQITVLYGVEAHAATLLYRYRIDVVDGLTREEISSAMTPILGRQMCGNPEAFKLLSAGAAFAFEYTSDSGHKFAPIVVRSCQRDELHGAKN